MPLQLDPVPTNLLDDVLRPLELAISHVLLAAHDLLAAVGLPADGGVTWATAIAVLVVVVRSALLPLVVRQVRASQRLAAAAPRVQQVRERYRGARDAESLARLRAETRAVYAEADARPLGCLPLLAQAPVLLALFHVLDAAAHGRPVGALAGSVAGHVGNATLAGASLAARMSSGGTASVVAVALTAVMAGSLWLLQRRQVTVNTAPGVLEGPGGTALRLSVWLLPATVLVSGFAFPIGVLVYVACTNLWSLGQQEVLLRRLPAPGSVAHARKLARESAG